MSVCNRLRNPILGNIPHDRAADFRLMRGNTYEKIPTFHELLRRTCRYLSFPVLSFDGEVP